MFPASQRETHHNDKLDRVTLEKMECRMQDERSGSTM